MHFLLRPLTGIIVIITIAAFYTVASISLRDPTSLFFDPYKGFAPRYSSIRRQQAEAFIAAHDYANPTDVTKASDDKKKGKLCVGIPSMNREGIRYLPAAVGSLLQGLTTEERQESYLVVFIPHAKPESHSAYTENWLPGLVDEILIYDFGPDHLQFVSNMEHQRGRVEKKALLDYSFLLSKCAQKTTPYIAIFEDDTVVMDGWYHRTIAALEEADKETVLHSSKIDSLHLRLFYTEEYLGWNAEHWQSYLWNSVMVALISTAVLVFIRICRPKATLSAALTTFCRFLALYAVLAILIAFYFGLGRNTVLPMSTGVHKMTSFGCCNQALVYPNYKTRKLIAYLKDRQTGHLDVDLEDHANEYNELRFAITPSVVQHVGRKDSKGVGEKVWSFAFERFSEKRLRKEHEKVARLREAAA
ncbi:integral membrane protein-like protein [Ophiobolus disseminans]|uniref:Integral membrane protein-like protein n=1 Tax=Ophiobolus disseminans TaxID=1469910 RepID=A0A6A6ZR61_9PLEO|nr:integral membrane protein-like protein [Ophiobolus disseminans]